MMNFEKRLFDEVLPLVVKPGRYVGNEINVIKKDWSKVDITFALIFPDLYELGMSHTGFEILYHILNRESFIAAERVFAPWPDLEKILREKKIPLFSLENKQSLKQFDILGFTLQYELHYTNILNMLELGGIPIYSKDREENDPLVIAGGPCAFNPEPMADFIDAFVIGDGEEIVIEIAELLRKLKASNADRQQILHELAKVESIYIPSFYDVEKQRFFSVASNTKVRARSIDCLDSNNYPKNPLVPLIETTHDRYSIEIMRGCTRGCRFCNAGSIYRPVRERSVDEIVKQSVAGIKSTGYKEISLLSLSTSDHSQLQLLLSKLSSSLSQKHVNISFPSLRAETFTYELAKHAKSVRKSGITLAPEAGTEYLRKVINKNNSNDDLLRAVTVAFEGGWKVVKLYFMIGQPKERIEDIEGIIELINQVVNIAKKNGGKRINISISPFVPKAHTPFQWVKLLDRAELEDKVDFLRKRITGNLVKLSWRDYEIPLLECVLGRGDRQIGKVIEYAHKNGARFDAWSEQFDFKLWEEAFKHCNIDVSNYCQEIDLTEKLPWDFIDKGITKSFLKQEYKKALNNEETDDCRLTSCNACGLITHPECQTIIHKKKQKKADDLNIDKDISDNYGRSRKLINVKVEPSIKKIRLKYSKNMDICFTSHLDMTRIFERTFLRAGIRLAYSQGFNPHPKMSFGPPLPMGYTSDAEYMDIQLLQDKVSDLGLILNRILPKGISILDAKILFGKKESLVSAINFATYYVYLNKNYDQSFLNNKIIDFSERDEILFKRIKKNGTQQVNIKDYIHEIKIGDNTASLLISTILENGKTARIDEILTELFGLTKEEVLLTRVKRLCLLISNSEETITPLEV